MIDAATARLRSRTVNTVTAKTQCDEIEKVVIKAVDEGKLEGFIYFHPHPAVQRKFEQLGYKIGKNNGMRNDVTIKVSWEEL